MLPMNELLQEGRYRITRHFGQNDIGLIYEGLDNIFEKNITINQCAYNGRKNLADEEKILKGIKHETFLSVADYFAEPNGWFTVMEAAGGEIFSDILKKENRDFSFSEVMNWAEQILDGLGYLHLHLPPIVYGDLKPQNIFLASDGKIKMLTSAILKIRCSANKTFGKPSAEALNYSPLEQIWDDLDLASQKVIAGSFDETAERILRQPVDARCDIYSLGVLLYQALTGQFPKNALERSIEILEGNTDPLISPSALNTEIPPEISEIILKALEIRRENRFDSAVIMRQALRTAFVRIKEREDAVETKQEAPEAAAATPESFSFSDLTDTEKVETVQEPQVEENKETENLLTKNEEIREAEKPSAVQDFEILSLDLPQTRPYDNPLEEIYEKETPAAEQSNEAAEMREELISENKSENEIKKISTEFFHFDEEDEKEILGVGKSSEEIKEPAETLEIIEEKAETVAASAEIISVKDSEKVTPEVIETDYKKDYSPGEFSVLFNESEKQSGSKWKVPAVALILILVGSGVFGAWMFMSKSGANEQTVTNQLNVNPPADTVSQPPTENLTETNTETSAATTETAESQTLSNTENAETAAETNAETNPVAAQETAPTAKKNAPVKAKPPAEKPQTAAAKTPAKKEKKVTVDDLISDY